MRSKRIQARPEWRTSSGSPLKRIVHPAQRFAQTLMRCVGSMAAPCSVLHQAMDIKCGVSVSRVAKEKATRSAAPHANPRPRRLGPATSSRKSGIGSGARKASLQQMPPRLAVVHRDLPGYRHRTLIVVMIGSDQPMTFSRLSPAPIVGERRAGVDSGAGMLQRERQPAQFLCQFPRPSASSAAYGGSGGAFQQKSSAASCQHIQFSAST